MTIFIECPQVQHHRYNLYSNLGELLIKVIHIRSKQGCKDQESIQSSTTPDPGYQWESDKLTVKHHKREPRGQPFPSR